MKVKKEIEILRRMADLLEENEHLRQAQDSYDPEPESGGFWSGVMLWTVMGLAGLGGYVYLQGGL